MMMMMMTRAMRSGVQFDDTNAAVGDRVCRNAKKKEESDRVCRSAKKTRKKNRLAKNTGRWSPQRPLPLGCAC